MSIQISAIICTFNSADYLRKAIESLVNQTLSKEQYEIIVVDNNSTDNTRQVVLREFLHVQNLRYLYEPIQGLSVARNTGWTHAIGKYVTFLDDDAIARPQWIEKMLDVFKTVKPMPGCIGGKIELIWEAARPSWLSDKILSYLGRLDLSEKPITLNHTTFLFGGNIAFPRDLLKAIGGFQVKFGRRGNKLLSNEEILLQQQIKAQGYHCFYHPEIVVWHHVPASRLTKDWFIRRSYWQGISDAALQIYLESPSTLRRLRMAISAGRNILWPPQSLSNLVVSTDDPERFEAKCSILARIGYILGLLSIAG